MSPVAKAPPAPNPHIKAKRYSIAITAFEDRAIDGVALACGYSQAQLGRIAGIEAVAIAWKRIADKEMTKSRARNILSTAIGQVAREML